MKDSELRDLEKQIAKNPGDATLQAKLSKEKLRLGQGTLVKSYRIRDSQGLYLGLKNYQANFQEEGKIFKSRPEAIKYLRKLAEETKEALDNRFYSTARQNMLEVLSKSIQEAVLVEFHTHTFEVSSEVLNIKQEIARLELDKIRKQKKVLEKKEKELLQKQESLEKLVEKKD